MPSKETHATLSAPLEPTPFAPHIVHIIGTPRMMLTLAQSSPYNFGGRVYPEFSNIQSVCSDATAQVYLSGKMNFSLSCDGSRKFSGIADEKMYWGYMQFSCRKSIQLCHS